ncbi:MAG TPA: type III secretion system export apparatus subunit SctV [Steroidobacter sp.]
MATSAAAMRNSAWRALFHQHDLLLAALIVAVIALMILPLRPFMLDTLIAVNLALSVVLLMVSLYVNSPLGLSTFPSLLLFTTLFRLSLNIAATRQILLHADAGEIIFTFGNLVVGGDIIVGIVVFLIIAIVQFVVIAKGAERVAEVGARFTLDAMPGKQMSIDADLRAGLIDKEEARTRRSLLERESHLYGAMDGAMKFVKGDAIAALIIAAVNIIAGVCVGTLRKGMDFSAALDTYSVLTVGDALVSQIPSLFVSIAAGVLITRVADPGRRQGTGLGDEIAEQLRAHPRALMIAGTVIVGLMLVPGFPKLQFLLIAAVVGLVGYSLLPSRRRYDVPGETPMPSMQRAGSNVVRPWLDSGDHALAPPVTVHIGAGIERLLSPQRLELEMRRVRRSLEGDLGVPFPGIVMRQVGGLQPGAYTILVNEIPVAVGSVATRGRLPEAKEPERHLLALVPSRTTPTHETQKATGPEHAFAQNLLRALRDHAEDFVGIQEVQLLLRRLAEDYPDLERELTRNVPLPRLTEVLKRLVREEISIRNLREIAHGLIDWAPREKDTVLVTEYVRTCLSRYISYRFANQDGSLSAVVLHPTVEEQMRQAIRQTSGGTVLMLNPATSQQIANQIRDAIQPFVGGDQSVVLLTSLELRPYLRKLTEIELGKVPVLSYQELVPTIRVNTLATVSL